MKREEEVEEEEERVGKPSQIDLVFTIEQINDVLALISIEETMACPLHFDSIE